MDQVSLQLLLDASRADAQLRKTAALGESLFSKKGFKINVSSTGLPLGRITGDFDNFRKSLDAAAARVIAFTATTGVIYGLADAFRRLFTESVKLEKQLASIQSILRVSGSELQTLSNDLLKTANATSQSFDVAVDAAVEFSRQGLTLEKTIEATNAALALSRIAGIDAADAVSTLTATINTFNQEGLTYQSVLDTIISLDNNFAASTAGISEGLKRVGGVASEAGLELKEVASLITAVQQVSARGEVTVANGFKTISTRLNRSAVQETLNSIGIRTKESNGEFRNQIAILTDLANKQDQLSDSTKAFVNETVAGVHQINTLQGILKATTGQYSLYNKALEVAGNSSGDTAARLRVLNDTASSSLTVLRNNLSRTFADIGTQTITPLLKEFTSLTNGILEFFQSSSLENAIGGIDSRGIAQKFASGFIDGIGSFLNSSGKTILVAIMARLFAGIGKDIAKGFFTLSGINQGNFVNKELQNSVNLAIATGNKALVARLALTNDIVRQNQILNTLLQQQSQLGNLSLTSTLVNRGLRSNGIRTKASGFIPALLKEKEDINRGVGGASKNARPLVKELNLGKGREKVVVNSDEAIVENYLNSGKDAIFNPNMIREAGGLQALKRFGKVKNFASGTGARKADLEKRLQKLLAAHGKEELSYMVSNPNDPFGFDSSPRGQVLNKNIHSLKSKIANLNRHPTPPPAAGRFPVTAASASRNAGLTLVGQEQSLIDNFIERDEKAQKRTRRSQAAVGVSVGLPFLAGASGLFEGESQGAKFGKNVLEGGSSGLAAAALLGFTPIGVASGILVAALSVLKGEADDNIKTFDSLKKNADKVIASNQKQVNAVQSTIAAQNQLTELLKSENSTPQERARVRQSIVSSSSQISDPEIRKLLLAGDNSKEAQGKISDFQQRQEQSSRVQESLLLARKATEEAQRNRTSFSNLNAFRDTPRASFDADNFDAFTAPIVDAIDLVKVKSGFAAVSLQQFSENLISGEEFIKRMGEAGALTGEIAGSTAEEFKNLADTFSADSIQALDRFIASQIKYKDTISELSKSLEKAESTTINFKKAFDNSLKNLVNQFSFDNFESTARAKSSLGINRDVLASKQEKGSITAIDAATEAAKIARQEADLSFAEKSNELFENALKPILGQAKNIKDPAKQGEVISKIISTLNGKSSLSDLDQSLKKLIGNSDESDDNLKEVKAAIEVVGKAAAELLVEQSVSNEEINKKLQIQINTLSKGPGIKDVLGGKTAEARAGLLDPAAMAKLNDGIKKASERIKNFGPTSKEGKQAASQRDSLVQQQQALLQRDRDARQTLLPGSNPKLSDSGTKQEAEVLAKDWYKTNAQILKSRLEEIDILSRKKLGSAKFGEDSIGKLVSLLEKGETGRVGSSLDNSRARTTNPEIIAILDEIKNSVLGKFSNEDVAFDSVNLPKAANIQEEEDKFLKSLAAKVDAENFKPSAKVQAVLDAEAKLKELGDQASLTANQLTNVYKAGAKNLNILDKNPGLRERINPEAQTRFITGQITQDIMDVASESTKNLVKSAGFEIPSKNANELQQKLNEQRKEIEELRKQRDEAVDSAKPEMEALRKAMDGVAAAISSLNSVGNSSRVEQQVALEIDVRGVDQTLAANLRSAFSSVIQDHINSTIKDTFNVAAVTKPTTVA